MDDISMPGYIKKKLQEYTHVLPLCMQACLYSSEPKKFGADLQTPLAVDSSPLLNEKDSKEYIKL
jgi:hypothetical protein